MSKKFDIKNLFKKREIVVETNPEEEDLYDAIEKKIKSRLKGKEVKVISKILQDKSCVEKEKEEKDIIPSIDERNIFDLTIDNVKKFSYRDTWSIRNNQMEKLNNVEIISLLQDLMHEPKKKIKEFENFKNEIDEEKILYNFNVNKNLKMLEKYLSYGYDTVIYLYLDILNSNLRRMEHSYKCNCKSCMFCFIYKDEKENMKINYSSDKIIEKKLSLLLMNTKENDTFKFQKHIIVYIEPKIIKNFILENNLDSSILYSYLIEDEDIQKRIRDDQITDILKNIDWIFSETKYENNDLQLKFYQECFLRYKDVFKNRNFENVSTFIQKIKEPPLQGYDLYYNISKFNKIIPLSLNILLENIILPKNIFYKIYSNFQNYIFDENMVNKIFKIDILRGKEYFKMYKFTKNNEYLEKCIKVLSRKEKEFILAKSKVLVYKKEFIQAYLNIPKKMKTIKSYIILSYFNLEKAILLLRNDLYSFKHVLLLIELIRKQNNQKISDDFIEIFSNLETIFISYGVEKRSAFTFSDLDNTIISIYELGLKKFSDSYEIKLSYVRFLKLKDLRLAEAVVDYFLTGKTIAEKELLFYEAYIIKRKLGKNATKILYKARKYIGTDILNQEVRYFENKDCDEKNLFFYLFFYKRYKDKNVDPQFLLKGLENNGDFFILLFLFDSNLLEKLEEIYEISDNNRGFYWCRTRNILDFKERIVLTVELFKFDQDY